MKVLVTGITGFAGSHLSAYLRGEGIEVSGLDLRPASEEFNAGFGDAPPPVHCCDLADSGRVAEVLARERPEAVVHLAARAQVAGAWEDAVAITQSNAVCTQSLMQAIHQAVPQARVLLISSSEVYGKVPPEQMPIDEQTPLKPNNPYSASKVAQEYIGLQYFHAFGAPIVIARPFNHIGPGQKGNFVVPAFASQLAEMEAGLREPVLRVGNLDAARDFTDVRDIVHGYWLALRKGEPGGIYNIASGSAHKIQHILDTLLKLSKIQPRVEPIPELMRPSDIPQVIGDASRLRSLGEWQPRVPLEQSLSDALDYWRRQVSQSG